MIAPARHHTVIQINHSSYLIDVLGALLLVTMIVILVVGDLRHAIYTMAVQSLFIALTGAVLARMQSLPVALFAGAAIGIVEQLMQMHAAALNELGVKLDEQAGGAQPAAAQPQGKKRPPIEDIL